MNNNEATLTDLMETVDTMSRRKRLAFTVGGWAAIGCVVFTVSYGIGKVISAIAENPTDLIDL